MPARRRAPAAAAAAIASPQLAPRGPVACPGSPSQPAESVLSHAASWEGEHGLLRKLRRAAAGFVRIASPARNPLTRDGLAERAWHEATSCRALRSRADRACAIHPRHDPLRELCMARQSPLIAPGADQGRLLKWCHLWLTPAALRRHSGVSHAGTCAGRMCMRRRAVPSSLTNACQPCACIDRATCMHVGGSRARHGQRWAAAAGSGSGGVKWLASAASSLKPVCRAESIPLAISAQVRHWQLRGP